MTKADSFPWPRAELELSYLRLYVDEHGVAIAVIDVPGERMNTLSRRLAGDMDRVVKHVARDPTIRALVLASGKPDSFVAGADIRAFAEFTCADDAARASRDAQGGIARLERLHLAARKPLVAAVHGPCLGGGLELVLACSHTILSDAPGTKLGVPEVKLGLIPGAGGTQRLPRRVGVAEALDLILTGRNVWPKKAVKLGLADEIVPAAILLDVARRRAREAAEGTWPEKARGKRGLRGVADADRLRRLALDSSLGRRVVLSKAKESLLEKTRGNYPAPERAIDVVRIGFEEGEEAGYAAEAEAFGELYESPQSQALVSIFFATQELKRESGVEAADVEPRPVRKLGVLGGGLMGGGVAAVTVARTDATVRINEVDDAGIARGLAYVRRLLDGQRKRKLRSAEGVEQAMCRVTGGTGYTGFASVDLVVEAVFEDLELKRRVLQEVEARARPETIFASNTSSLPISGIAAASARPETVVGMHYFSPVEKMPLLEVVVTEQTADWVTATAVDLGKRQGKTVIVVRDGAGFYTSRILAPYMNEAAWLLAESHAAIDQIDDVMTDWGFPVGPVVLLDEVGIDVAAKVAKILFEAFGDRLKPPDTMDALLSDGRLGRKSGRGFYRYEAGTKAGVDPSVYAAIGQDEERRRLPPGKIQRRLGLAMVNEAARCLQEGILRSARDGDIGAIFGLGFPPFFGGPFSYVDRVGAAEVVRRLERLEAQHGRRFEPAEILRDYARAGRKFRR